MFSLIKLINVFFLRVTFLFLVVVTEGFSTEFPDTITYRMPYQEVISTEGNDRLSRDELTRLSSPEKSGALTLAIRGASERSFLFFSIYDIAFFSQDITDRLEPPYALEILYKRNLSKSSIDSALREGLANNSSAKEQALVLDAYERFLSPALKDVNEADGLSLVRLSAVVCLVLFNGEQVGLIENKTLLDALFAIWLGEDSVVSREELLPFRGL